MFFVFWLFFNFLSCIEFRNEIFSQMPDFCNSRRQTYVNSEILSRRSTLFEIKNVLFASDLRLIWIRNRTAAVRKWLYLHKLQINSFFDMNLINIFIHFWVGRKQIWWNYHSNYPINPIEDVDVVNRYSSIPFSNKNA